MLICLDWAKSFWIHQIFSSGPGFGPMSQPVCAAWQYLGVDFSLWHTWKCVQVSHQELGTVGPVLGQLPNLQASFWSWPDEFLCTWDFPSPGLQLCSDCLFFVLHSVTAGLCYFPFLIWYHLWGDFDVTSACEMLPVPFWRQSCECLSSVGF